VDSAAVLEIQDLHVKRDGETILSDVSLQVEPGSLHLLVGPNGAGKSTLFAAVLAQIPFSGVIQFRWRSSGRLGYVPQRFTLDRTLPLTVGDFLALGRQRWPVCLGTRRAVRKRIDELLEGVGLVGFAARSLATLSGGELQRVLFANAIEPWPEFLLLDEPASGLDETSARYLEAALCELRRRGTGVLMVSHDPALVRRIADRVTLIDRRVYDSGDPDRVLDRSSSGRSGLVSDHAAR